MTKNNQCQVKAFLYLQLIGNLMHFPRADK